MSFIKVVAAFVKLILGFRINKFGPLQPKLWSISWDFHNLGYLFVCVQILGLISVLISY